MSNQRAVIEIDDDKFDLQAMGARAQLKMFHRLTAIIGPAFAKFGGLETAVDLADLGSVDVGELAGALGGAVSVLYDRASPDQLEAITMELLDGCLVNGKPLKPQFDVIMRGRMMAVAKLIAGALELNYADFYDAARSKLAVLAARKTTKRVPSSSSESST